MGIDGLLIAVLNKKEDHQRIAAKMSGAIEASKRVEDVMPKAVSVITKNKNITAIPLSETYVIVLIGTKSLNILNAVKHIEKNRLNIISMIENKEFSDVFSFSPVEVDGLDWYFLIISIFSN